MPNTNILTIPEKWKKNRLMRCGHPITTVDRTDATPTFCFPPIFFSRRSSQVAPLVRQRSRDCPYRASHGYWHNFWIQFSFTMNFFPHIFITRNSAPDLNELIYLKRKIAPMFWATDVTGREPSESQEIIWNLSNLFPPSPSHYQQETTLTLHKWFPI